MNRHARTLGSEPEGKLFPGIHANDSTAREDVDGRDKPMGADRDMYRANVPRIRAGRGGDSPPFVSRWWCAGRAPAGCLRPW
jgi:hypothetical protein